MQSSEFMIASQYNCYSSEDEENAQHLYRKCNPCIP